MFIFIEHKRTWEKGEHNRVREYSPAATPEPKQNKGAITIWWSGTQSSYYEKLKQTDLFFCPCPMQAYEVNSLLNSLNNKMKISTSLGLYKYSFGKCSFWKGLHRWAGDMSHGGFSRSSQLLVSQHPSAGLRHLLIESAHWVACKGQRRTLPPECHI